MFVRRARANLSVAPGALIERPRAQRRRQRMSTGHGERVPPEVVAVQERRRDEDRRRQPALLHLGGAERDGALVRIIEGEHRRGPLARVTGQSGFQGNDIVRAHERIELLGRSGAAASEASDRHGSCASSGTML